MTELLDQKEQQEPVDISSLEDKRSSSDCRNRTAMVLVALSLGFQEFPNLAISYFFKDDLHLDLT